MSHLELYFSECDPSAEFDPSDFSGKLNQSLSLAWGQRRGQIITDNIFNIFTKMLEIKEGQAQTTFWKLGGYSQDPYMKVLFTKVLSPLVEFQSFSEVLNVHQHNLFLPF